MGDKVTKPMTRLETQLSVEAPIEERRQTLTELRADERPDQDTIAAVVTLLNDSDDILRETATTLLQHWGQPAISALLKALRSTEPLDVPYRLALIKQLALMGSQALRAETLLRSLANDPNVGEEALNAVKVIRQDGRDLLNRFGDWGAELLLLSTSVAAPIVGMRVAGPKQVWPPVGLVIGFAMLAVMGLMLARFVYSGDLLPDRESDRSIALKRRMNYIALGVIGTVTGIVLTGMMCAWGGAIGRMIGN